MKKLVDFSLTTQFLVVYWFSVAVATVLTVQVVFLRNWQMSEVRPMYLVMLLPCSILTVLFLMRGAVKAIRYDRAKRAS